MRREQPGSISQVGSDKGITQGESVKRGQLGGTNQEGSVRRDQPGGAIRWGQPRWISQKGLGKRE